jgi:hypothetical protein
LEPPGDPGNVRLDKVTERFGGTSTELTLVALFNLLP